MICAKTRAIPIHPEVLKLSGHGDLSCKKSAGQIADRQRCTYMLLSNRTRDANVITPRRLIYCYSSRVQHYVYISSDLVKLSNRLFSNYLYCYLLTSMYALSTGTPLEIAVRRERNKTKSVHALYRVIFPNVPFGCSCRAYGNNIQVSFSSHFYFLKPTMHRPAGTTDQAMLRVVVICWINSTVVFETNTWQSLPRIQPLAIFFGQNHPLWIMYVVKTGNTRFPGYNTYCNATARTAYCYDSDTGFATKSNTNLTPVPALSSWRSETAANLLYIISRSIFLTASACRPPSRFGAACRRSRWKPINP
jgi:hypothetical protein